MSRILLYVPFEESREAEQAGALRDPSSKCWYIRADQERRPFHRWLRPAASEDYSIVSDDAYVATATTACWRCGSPTQVICLYCKSGEICGQTYDEFTVSNVTALEAPLRRQLARWPNFRIVNRGGATGRRCFANHCDHCSARQDDYFLHCEPGGVFFAPSAAAPSAIKLIGLSGRARFSGDEGFEPG